MNVCRCSVGDSQPVDAIRHSAIASLVSYQCIHSLTPAEHEPLVKFLHDTRGSDIESPSANTKVRCSSCTNSVKRNCRKVFDNKVRMKEAMLSSDDTCC